MSEVREKFIKVIESLPYNIDEEIFKRDTLEILKDVTKRYIETYGDSDLTKRDKECIKELIGEEV